jgi:hypothetical protein
MQPREMAWGERCMVFTGYSVVSGSGARSIDCNVQRRCREKEQVNARALLLLQVRAIKDSLADQRISPAILGVLCGQPYQPRLIAFINPAQRQARMVCIRPATVEDLMQVRVHAYALDVVPCVHASMHQRVFLSHCARSSVLQMQRCNLLW